ncbi:hypothetical protein ACQ4PT_050962 [Festuca glaucescens]
MAGRRTPQSRLCAGASLYRPKKALSWKNDRSVEDGIQACKPYPHPFTLCKSEAEAFGYPCEDHKVTTEDGYILSLKRIPHGPSTGDNSTDNENTRPPVLLFHGLMVAYWDWSWDEIAAYDLPAVLQFVYDHTGATNVLLHDRLVAREILLTVCGNPEVDCHDVFSALAGPDCCLNATSTCAFLEHAIQSTSVRNLVHLSQSKNLNQKLKFQWFEAHLGTTLFFLIWICVQSVVRHKGIRRYDYGNAKANMKHYNQTRPPLYNLSTIPTHVPMLLMHGGQDFLGDVPDTRHLLKTLVRNHDKDNIEVLYVPDYAHADFVIGFNAPELVYGPMVDFFQRH